MLISLGGKLVELDLRKLPNGNLYAPHRGKPPACPDGYVQEDYIYKPIVDPCQYRIKKEIPCNCTNPKYTLWCNRMRRKVNLGICKECQNAR